MVKTVQIGRPITFESTGAVAQLLECSVCVRGVMGSIPDRVIPKTLKMVLAALSFELSIEKAEQVGPLSVYCDWVECHVMCLRCDMSVRQHS